MVPSFDIQQHNHDQHKTLNQIVEEAFSVKKPVVDLSFFYNDERTPTEEKVIDSSHFLEKE